MVTANNDCKLNVIENFKLNTSYVFISKLYNRGKYKKHMCYTNIPVMWKDSSPRPLWWDF